MAGLLVRCGLAEFVFENQGLLGVAVFCMLCAALGMGGVALEAEKRIQRRMLVPILLLPAISGLLIWSMIAMDSALAIQAASIAAAGRHAEAASLYDKLSNDASRSAAIDQWLAAARQMAAAGRHAEAAAMYGKLSAAVARSAAPDQCLTAAKQATLTGDADGAVTICQQLWQTHVHDSDDPSAKNTNTPKAQQIAKAWMAGARAQTGEAREKTLNDICVKYEGTKIAGEARMLRNDLMFSRAKAAESAHQWQNAGAAYSALSGEGYWSKARGGAPVRARVASGYARCLRELAMAEGREGKYCQGAERWFSHKSELPNMAPLPPAFYVQAGRQYEQNQQLDGAKRCYQFVTTVFPSTSQAAVARGRLSSIVDAEVAKIAGGEHGDLPEARRVGGGRRVSYSITNSTGRTLHVLFSGAASQAVTLAPDEATVVRMPKGSYGVAARVDDASVIPFYAKRDLHGAYESNFVIETRTY